MASKSGLDFFGDGCANCKIFKWEQVDPKTSPLKRCTGCWKISYCSKECQEEHWHKVHKKHCKYLGGIKKAEHSEHNKETCKTCIKQDSVGDLVFSPTNPNYVCIFEHVDWSLLPPTYPHPFPLTASPEDRIEKMLTVAQKILLKIKVTKNPVYLLQRQLLDKMEEDLWKMRSEIYLNRICGGDQDPEKIWIIVTENLRSCNILWKVLREFLGSHYVQMGGDHYKLLTTFALVAELLRSTNYIQKENVLKSPNSLPRDFRQMTKKKEYFEVADKIIEALDQEVVPCSHLAAIACGGKLEHNCSQCHKKIIVDEILVEDCSFKALTPKIVFKPIETERYVCGASECFNKEWQRGNDKQSSWFMAVLGTFRKLKETRCDRCFLLAPLNEVHRSKCLTKNYCSQVCRDADDAVHKVCCNPDKEQRRIEERKVKIGGKDKVEAANAEIEFFGKFMMSKLPLHFNPAEVKSVGEVIEKTKKTKPRVKSAKKKKETRIDEVD